MDRQALPFFPAADGADVAFQMGGNLLPGIEPIIGTAIRMVIRGVADFRNLPSFRHGRG